MHSGDLHSGDRSNISTPVSYGNDAPNSEGKGGLKLLSIRPYVEADFNIVTSIHWLSSWQSTHVAAPLTLVELRERWPQELAKGWIVHVATVGSEVVGFVAFCGDVLELLFVAPDYQCRGIGKRLLDFAKNQMSDGFHLTTPLQSRAGRFYEREGLRRGEITAHQRFGYPEIRYDWSP
ncbi:MAG TPA: GNAT family N-acetyltransferase [Rhizomicrobium sp.]|nr:GNAT family N-acetyltransferase [Rhizomicrobium sp.]